MQNLLRRTTVFFLYLTVLVTPFLFTFVNIELFEFNKMLFVYAMTAVLATTWIARMLLSKTVLFRRTPLDIPLLLFLGGQLIALLFSLDARTSFLGYYTRFHGGLLSWICYALVYWVSVSTLSYREWLRLAATMLASLFGSVLYAFPEHFGHSPSCIALRGNFDVSCWVQDVQHRVFGTFGQPNWLAAYIVVLLPLAGITALRSRILQLFSNTHLMQWFAGITTLLAWTTLLFTKSRSGLLAAAVAAMVMGIGLAITWYRDDENRTVFSKKSILLPTGLLLSGVLFITGMVGTPWTPSIGEFFQESKAPTRETTTTPANRLENGGTESGEIRKIVWQGAIDVWRRYPLFGSGPSTFAYSYYTDRPIEHNTVSEWDFLYNKAHNEFLDFLATTGSIGFGTYLILMGSIWWIGGRILFKNGEYSLDLRLLVLSMLAGHAALHASNFFGFSTVAPTVIQFLFLGMITRISIEPADPYSTGQSSSDEDLEAWQYAALVGLVLIALFGLGQVWRWWRADQLAAQAEQLRQQNQLSQSAQTLEKALQLMPHEPLLYESMSQSTGQLALGLAQIGEATAASQIAALAEETSAEALRRNPYHLNFYRSQTRLYIWLSNLDPSYLEKAATTIQDAQRLAPTDPKLVYLEGVIAEEQNNIDAAIDSYQRAVAMKPNYKTARTSLATLQIQEARWQAAADQLQYILQFIDPNDTIVTQQLENITATTSAEITSRDERQQPTTAREALLDAE